MKKNSNYTALVTVAVLLLAMVAPSFALKKDDDRARTVAKKELPGNDKRRYDYFFLEAVRQQNAGHFDAAYDLFSHCLQIDSAAAEPYYMLAMYLSNLKQDSLALLNIEKAASLDPSNATYQERVAQYYINAGNYDRAIVNYERLFASNHDRSDVLHILVQLYQQQKDYDGMLSAIDRIEQADGSSEEITLSKMRVYELKGDSKAAYKTLKKLSDTHPNDLNYKVMLGNWLMQNSKPKEAFKMFTSTLKEEPGNAYAQSSLYDYYNAMGNKSEALRLRKAILLSKKTSPETKQLLLQEVIKESEDAGGDSVGVLALFKEVLATDARNAEVATLQAAYMTLKKMPVTVIDSALQHVLDISPENTGARMQLVRSYLDRQEWDRVIALCQPGTQYTPQEMAFYYFMGWAAFQKGDTDAALDAFRRGVGEINSQSDPDIASDFYSMMGDLLHGKGMHNEAFAAYDSCLQWKPTNVYCLNNYAYYLSERNQDLARAEQMSYKTIKAEPANSTFLDTYAWILYMQERFVEAKIYIDQALRNDTDSVKSAVIIEHAGDIYLKNNDRKRAIHYWREAVAAGGDKTALERKIRKAEYYTEQKKKK